MKTRTSASHPLRVNFIEGLPYPGRLGLTLAPGKKGPSYYGGSWDRDLDADLTVLRDEVGADVLVTLMEDHEMAAAEIPDLLQRAEAYGMRAIHFPIVDTRVPAPEQERDFDAMVDRLLGELRREATVVVHCRGGLGRSGLVAACLLARSGASADEAMSRVRSARPGAIETRGQERYVRAYAERVMPTRGVSLAERYRGALLGLAAGDALGTTVEFRRPGTFEPLTTIVGGGPFHLEPGQWTDDTSMALCLAESIVERQGFDPVDQLQRYLRWWREGYWSSTGAHFDIGNTTAQALARFRDTGEPYPGEANPSGAGNGSIMRLAPVPLAFAPEPRKAIEYAAASSRTTHGAKQAIDACRYLGGMILGALAGQDKQTLLSPRYTPVAGLWEREPLHQEIDEVAAGSFQRRDPPQITGSGYVVRSLEAALWAFAKSDGFEEGALLAVNLGDDADTTGAVYGQLAGAYYGAEAIPGTWRSLLTFHDDIVRLADGLLAFREARGEAEA